MNRLNESNHNTATAVIMHHTSYIVRSCCYENTKCIQTSIVYLWRFSISAAMKLFTNWLCCSFERWCICFQIAAYQEARREKTAFFDQMSSVELLFGSNMTIGYNRLSMHSLINRKSHQNHSLHASINFDPSHCLWSIQCFISSEIKLKTNKMIESRNILGYRKRSDCPEPNYESYCCSSAIVQVVNILAAPKNVDLYSRPHTITIYACANVGPWKIDSTKWRRETRSSILPKNKTWNNWPYAPNLVGNG